MIKITCVQKLKEHRVKVQNLLSETDKELNNITHIIEYVQISDKEKIHLCNLYASHSRRRRKLKHIISEVDSVLAVLEKHKVPSVGLKDATYSLEAHEAHKKIFGEK